MSFYKKIPHNTTHMKKQYENRIANIFSISDVLLSILSFVVAYFIRKYFFDRGLSYSEQYITLALLMLPMWYILFKFANLAEFNRTKSYSVLLFEYIIVVVIGMGILFLFIFAFKLDDISRVVLFIFGGLYLILLFTSKVLLYEYLKRFGKTDSARINALLIADKTSADFIKLLKNSNDWGYNIVSIATNTPEIEAEFGGDTKIIPHNEQIGHEIANQVIDEVIYCKNDFKQHEIKELIYSCQEVGVDFILNSEIFSMIANKAHLAYFGELPAMALKNTPSDRIALKIKHITDFLMAFFGLLLLSPVLLVVAVLIKVTSPGPVIFKQKRVGLRGREFSMYKFRTMVKNAEALKAKLEDQNEMDGPVFKIKNDPRLTPIGAFLRKTSIDEIPQFFNVLKGEMSIVGPRPPVPDEVKKYERWQIRRLSMRPGITCIWQVSGRNQIGFDDWMKMDLLYIDNWSLKLDLVLLFKTIRTIFERSGE